MMLRGSRWTLAIDTGYIIIVHKCVRTAQAQVHSLFLYSHNLMGWQPGTTGERSPVQVIECYWDKLII